MGTNDSLAPDPPWFPKPPPPHAPEVHGVDKEGRHVNLPYIRYALMDDDPVLLGVAGRDQEIFGEPLRAFPAPPVPFTTHINNRALEGLYTDHPFTWAQQIALYRLGDAGVLGDVHRLRTSYQKLKWLKHEQETLSRILGSIQKEQTLHIESISKFVQETLDVREQLTQARVMSRIAPILARMSMKEESLTRSMLNQCPSIMFLQL
jgi:hypothetical protein